MKKQKPTAKTNVLVKFMKEVFSTLFQSSENQDFKRLKNFIC
jgi:hypothetical protein